MQYSIGQVLNSRYRIVRLLGQGGFGAVYRAWDMNLNQACALKENLDTSPEAQLAFTREATVLSRLTHPNLPRVIDHFTITGQGQYLVMDYVEGEDLEQILQRQGSIDPDQALDWTCQIADALTFLHSQPKPIVHRDIKPANIRITPEGKAMLVDFGLVKIYDPSRSTTLGLMAGTPGYSPPEMYGKGAADPRTDIYALGATLYTALTSIEPPESIQRISADTLQPIYKVNPNISKAISSSVERAMSLNPSRRFQTAAEFKTNLTAGGPGGGGSSIPTVRSVPPYPKRRNSGVTWMLSLFAGLILLNLWIFNPGGFIPKNQIFGYVASVLFTPTAFVETDVSAIQDEPTNSPTPTDTITPTPEPTSTLTPIPPTFTPTPTETPVPSPTPVPLSGGPVIGGADKIAFLANKDIYIADMNGGNIKRLTTDGWEKTNLQWMPGGKWVAFVIGRCVMMVDIETEQTNTILCVPWVEEITGFEISPDGTKVALSLLDEGLYILRYNLPLLSQVRTRNQLQSDVFCNRYSEFPTKAVRWSSDSNTVAVVIVWSKNNVYEMIHRVGVGNCGSLTRAGADLLGSDFAVTSREYRNDPKVVDLAWNGQDLISFSVKKVQNDGYAYVYNMRTNEFIFNKEILGKQFFAPNEFECCYRNYLWTPDGNYLLFTFKPSLNNPRAPNVYLIPFASISNPTEYQPLPFSELLNRTGDDIEAAFRRVVPVGNGVNQ